MSSFNKLNNRSMTITYHFHCIWVISMSDRHIIAFCYDFGLKSKNINKHSIRTSHHSCASLLVLETISSVASFSIVCELEWVESFSPNRKQARTRKVGKRDGTWNEGYILWDKGYIFWNYLYLTCYFDFWSSEFFGSRICGIDTEKGWPETVDFSGNPRINHKIGYSGPSFESVIWNPSSF